MRRFHTCVCSTLHLPVEERRFIEDLIADSRAGRSVVARTDLSIVALHDGYMIHDAWKRTSKPLKTAENRYFQPASAGFSFA